MFQPIRRFVMLSLVVALSATSARADDYKLETLDSPPDDLPAAIAEAVSGKGFRVEGPRRTHVDVWLAKSIAIRPEFSPTLSVKYPFTPGQLIGVMEVPRRSDLTDFRGQEMERGVYTLRYAQQPVDGNHIGTSELADFLVAIPADKEESAEPITEIMKLNELSAEASGTTHPAIFSLLPTSEADGKPALTHMEEQEFWTLQVQADGKKGEESVKLPLRLVVVGYTEA
ncbi:hypothetical protein Mal4_50160 [Maioricimonas rarisocia]|uniref:DUF4198 domain-containing protein n=1 Tax=Maioricimonas rarisocia TaxID=2528026 RepID=A0A517ZDV5_9PLAN|nr:hypothetical protein [Maioricimonas rarisocia]QDU40658.1 hypothetical protein Mal4_50160 [Maioricimonas rarisocia]